MPPWQYPKRAKSAHLGVIGYLLIVIPPPAKSKEQLMSRAKKPNITTMALPIGNLVRFTHNWNNGTME